MKKLHKLVQACIKQAELLARNVAQPSVDGLIEVERALLGPHGITLSDAKNFRERVMVRVAWEVVDLAREFRRVLARGNHPRRLGYILARMEYLALGIESLMKGRPLIDLSINEGMWWVNLPMRERLKATAVAAYDHMVYELADRIHGWPQANFELPHIIVEIHDSLCRGEKDNPEVMKAADDLYEAYLSVDSVTNKPF